MRKIMKRYILKSTILTAAILITDAYGGQEKGSKLEEEIQAEIKHQKILNKINDLDLSTLTPQQGFAINGASAGDQSGVSVNQAGDVNGDGIQDIIIGAWDAINSAGASYVIYGKKGGYRESINLVNLTATDGFSIYGASFGDQLGLSASQAGDINADGIQDVIIGAREAIGGAGASYVIYGRKGGYRESINLVNLTATDGFSIYGASSGDQSGISVSQAGDINADGIQDIIIGAWFAPASYVVYGKKGGYKGPLYLGNLTSTDGFTIYGASNDRTGTSVSQAGDINADGIQDVIVGASSAGDTGASYVIYGRKGGYKYPIYLGNFTANEGFAIWGDSGESFFGGSVSQAGDINADGIQDIIIGALDELSNAGASYVIYGKRGGYKQPIYLSNFTSTEGFSIYGASSGDQSGTSVSWAGDINADGIQDIIIGAIGASPNGRNLAGAGYIIYGKEGGYKQPIYLGNLTASNGFTIYGAYAGDRTGGFVRQAGDINADGIQDIIIGAWDASPNDISGAGASYVIYGNSSYSATVPYNLRKLVKDIPSKKTLSVDDEIVRLHKKSDLQVLTNRQNTLEIGVSNLVEFKETQKFLPSKSSFLASSSSSLRAAWYSPVRWYEAVKTLWSTSQAPLSSEAESLVSLKNKCNDLIEEVTDKGYAFNLKDLVRDMEEALEHPQAITEKTVMRFEGYLQDLNREYAREESQPLSPYMQALLLGRTQSNAPLSFTSKMDLYAIGTLPQAPMLTSGFVLPALSQ